MNKSYAIYKTIVKKLLAVAWIIGAVILMQGCAPSSYIIQNPTPSTVSYEGSFKGKALTINDARPNDGKVFSYGVLKADLKLDGVSIDPIAYLAVNTQRELEARGIQTSVSDGDDVKIDINKFNMRNHRRSGFSPFVTLTMLSADVTIDGNKERIAAYIKRGKVPVWSFSEIVQPTLNEPLDILVKEFAAKLSSRLYGARISDGEVQSLVASIKAARGDKQAYINVYQLGFGNNKSAIPALVDLSNSSHEYVRLAAISSLGILGAEDELDLLKSIAQNAKLWQDRGMALKAIGDIGGTEAINFLQKTKRELAWKKRGREREWSAEIIDLYIY